MKYAKSNYPIGSIWTCTHPNGKIGYITLARREENIEVWHYGYRYSDGSGLTFDWAPSYALAKKNHFVHGKFKRVK